MRRIPHVGVPLHLLVTITKNNKADLHSQDSVSRGGGHNGRKIVAANKTFPGSDELCQKDC
jgi:hypothetical protein